MSSQLPKEIADQSSVERNAYLQACSVRRNELNQERDRLERRAAAVSAEKRFARRVMFERLRDWRWWVGKILRPKIIWPAMIIGFGNLLLWFLNPK